jgi:hypothetical protein
MGHTHYFYRKAELDKKDFSRYVGLIKKMVDTPEAQKILAEEYDEPNKPALVSDDLIKFNGKDDDGHETFYFPRVLSSQYHATTKNGLTFDFCKTARKPYDKYVVAALIIAKVAFGKHVKFSSDGEIDEMTEGKMLATEILGAKEIYVTETPDGISVGLPYPVSDNSQEKNCNKYQKHE